MSALATSADFLQAMARSSRDRVARARLTQGDEAPKALAHAAAAAPELKLSPLGFDLIAEVKRRSPAVGQLDSRGEDVGGRASDSALAGAAAISGSTDQALC